MTGWRVSWLERQTEEVGVKTLVYLYGHSFRSWRKRLAGIYRFAKAKGWSVRVQEISELKGGFSRFIEFWGVNGAIVEGGIPEKYASVLRALKDGFPVVRCDFDESKVGSGWFGVCHDSSTTAKLAISELLKRHCASYGYVGICKAPRDWAKERKRVFLEAMSEAKGIGSVFDPAEDSIVPNVMGFYSQLKTWLTTLKRPCGVFATNDEIGDYVLRAARDVGIRVPDEMIVIGVDDDRLLCESTTPTLASVSPDFEKSGYLAAELLARRLKCPELKPEVIRFSAGTVVPRESLRMFGHRLGAALKAVEFVRLHACEGIKVDDVARVMGMRRRSAEIHFARSVGHSIQDEIEHVRFRRACELIRKDEVRLDSVHPLVGYGHARSLRHLFYKECGMSPSEWRARNEE